MAKPSPRKTERREKKRQKRKTRERPHLAKKDMMARFPDVLYDGTASEWLMTEVERSLKNILSEHHRLLPPVMVDAFRRAKAKGFAPVLKDNACEQVAKLLEMKETDPEGYYRQVLSCNHLYCRRWER